MKEVRGRGCPHPRGVALYYTTLSPQTQLRTSQEQGNIMVRTGESIRQPKGKKE